MNPTQADIRSYFDMIDHEKLMLLVARRVSDRRMLKLLRQWLEAGVMEDSVVRETTVGTPQGGVISPLLSKSTCTCWTRCACATEPLWGRWCATRTTLS